MAPTAIAEEKRLFYNSFSAGVLNVDELRTNTLFWQFNFDHSDFFAGIDLNLLTSERKPENIDSIVIRRLEYDNGTEGFIYGPLTDYNLGLGLVLRGYSSVDRDSVLFTNEGMGARAYYLGEFFDLELMGTWSHVYGIRVSEDIYGITFGQTYVLDADGEKIIQENGEEKIFKEHSVAGFDIDAPIFGDFDFIAEAARIRGVANGYSAGFQWGYNVIAVSVSAKLEGRYLEKGFAPAYFGWGYELNPIDLVSLEAYGKPRSGYYAELQGSVFNYFNLNVAYETYEESNGAFYFNSWIKIHDRLLFSAYNKQPSLADYRVVGLEDGTIQGASLRFDISPTTFLSGLVKKGFNPRVGAVENSSILEIGFIF